MLIDVGMKLRRSWDLGFVGKGNIVMNIFSRSMLLSEERNDWHMRVWYIRISRCSSFSDRIN